MRKYRLTVGTWRGDSITVADSAEEHKTAQHAEILQVRFTFRIEKNINSLYQFGEINIYNLSPETETDIFKNGNSVILEAGYENGAFGQIFRGAIRQAIRGKEDGVTYFLKLVCIVGDEELNVGLCNLTLSANQDARTIIQQIARSSSVPFDVNIDQALSLQTTQRGKSVFGKPGDHLRSIALNNNAVFYFDDGVANLSPLSKAPPSVLPELNATNGMIGIPHQTDNGVEVRCLINPNIRLDSWIKLNNRDIIQAVVEIGQLQTLLDLDGVYRIVELVATGDTRGNDWYYDLLTFSQVGQLPAMLTDKNQVAN